MSKRICVDTHALIWGVQKQSRPSQQSMIPLAVGFFEKCKDDNSIVVVPAIAVAEMLAKIPPEERTRFQETIEFDALYAAVESLRTRSEYWQVGEIHAARLPDLNLQVNVTITSQKWTRRQDAAA